MGQLTQQNQELSLKDKLHLKRTSKCLLIDTSSSMSEDVEPGCTKEQAVHRILQGLQGNPPIIAFNDTAIEVTKSTVPVADGGTALSPAFTIMKERGYKQGVVITDGEVNSWDQEASLLAVSGLTIEVLYVGPGPKPPFLDKLANASGGYCSQEDLHQIKELGEKVQKLLGPAPGSRTIQL